MKDSKEKHHHKSEHHDNDEHNHSHKHDHEHSHKHHSGHSHHHGTERIGITVLLNIVITVAQIIGGLLSGSLSLLSDAAHNFSDVIALIISYIGNRMAKLPYSDNRTFGYKRAEIIAALINVVSIILIGVFIFLEAIERIGNVQPIHGITVIALAGLSIVMNGLSVLLLQKQAQGNLNIKSAYLHLFSDMLTSIAVLISGVLIYFFNMYWIDTVLSVLIAVYLVVTSIKLLMETLSILMLFAPKEYHVDEVKETITALNGVQGIHHIHAWKLTDSECHFEAHIRIKEDILVSESVSLKNDIKHLIKELGFSHVTLEMEFGECEDSECS